ncbi:CRISPR-associated protein, Cas1 family [Caminicella sporogenes DSM 14501]|uniref:CRISPR-associated endonuclease Cas1 n=1 Tax=Caminicella sporogenes DSM 14501 TaxID=1121266 RepID=A0A1M6TP35_9FIRM|nr:type I-B CRISPR-associated endonuclease Cas1b [Caminicella sporogenes]RKD24806.1 subtype I-B CRISPR-associated endonuclease Cas1 [Caminicella sporogenes]SHK58751.1 CRISPR-associated protein, Cas1 family [Caminicella sporogenes DSM 14501]
MGKDYYIFSTGRIKRKENTIYFYDEEGNKRALPIEDVEKLHFLGEVDLNTKFLNIISKYDIILNFYNYYGFYIGSYYPRKKNVSGFLVVKQSMYYNDLRKRMCLASCFIESAVFHILRNLRRYENTEKYIEKIENERQNIFNVAQIDELMGIEGRIRKIYYEAFNDILKNGFNMKNREKRPPTDPVNALISFGNSLMYTAVLGEIYKTQLDPTISFLHEPSTKRFSLSLDLAEIFKPLVVDTVIFKLINNRMITLKDFDIKEGICFLNEQGKRKFIKEFEEKLSTTIKHRKLKRKVSYKGFIKLECYKIIKHLFNDEIYKPLKAWW